MELVPNMLEIARSHDDHRSAPRNRESHSDATLKNFDSSVCPAPLLPAAIARAAICSPTQRICCGDTLPPASDGDVDNHLRHQIAPDKGLLPLGTQKVLFRFRYCIRQAKSANPSGVRRRSPAIPIPETWVARHTAGEPSGPMKS